MKALRGLFGALLALCGAWIAQARLKPYADEMTIALFVSATLLVALVLSDD